MTASQSERNDPELVVFNLKKRFTGVSATINSLVPLQQQQWRLAFCGVTLPNGVAGITVRDALRLSRKPPSGRPFRIWHVRRDHEMMLGIWARDVLRLPIKLVFTSAAQHLHGWFPRWLISRMDAVIATTQRAASFVPNTKAVVPHGIDLTRFQAPTDKKEAWERSGLAGQFGIGIFGRIRPEKGTDIFVQAMLQALPRLPHCTAVISGLALAEHQTYQKDLQQQIDAAGLHDRIVFLGQVSDDEVREWYKRCLLCVACPRYEPFGLTPFEAAASGCALVCSRTGAFGELVVPGENGYLVDPGDVEGLVDAVVKVMRDPEHAKALGQAARTGVCKNFSLEKEAQGIGKVYQQLFDKACA